MKKDYGTLRRHVLCIPYEIIMFAAVVMTFMQGSWKYFSLSLFTFSASFIPLYLERKFRVKILASLQTIYVTFVFASMFSGEVLAMYARVWPWDDWIHFISGLLMGLTLMLWFMVYSYRQKRLCIPIWLQGVIIVCVSTTVEVIWEIIEFASDQTIGTFSQGADLNDTMFDLIWGPTGGLIMAIIWVLYLKNKNVFVISWLFDRFKRLNNMR